MRRSSRRDNSDEHYIIDLCDHVLGQTAQRNHRFAFLFGDPNDNGRCAALPVDAYYEHLNLVIEYMESQHSRETPFFDKPDKMTASGVHRGVQRRLYDERRAAILPKHGITLLKLNLSDFPNRAGKKLRRQREQDEMTVREKLAPFLSNVDIHMR
jgi:hypothetical protein